MSKEYYNYQCASCCCTLYADALPKGEKYTSIINGSLCGSCRYEQEQSNNDYYDDDD